MTTPHPISFVAAASDFAAGKDTPRDLLERCLARIEEFEPAVGAFVCHDIAAARSVDVILDRQLEILRPHIAAIDQDEILAASGDDSRISAPVATLPLVWGEPSSAARRCRAARHRDQERVP